jgi:hypothetical protein
MDNNAASIIPGTSFDITKVFFSVKTQDISERLSTRKSEDVINLKFVDTSSTTSSIDNAKLDHKVQTLSVFENVKIQSLQRKNDDANPTNLNYLLKENSYKKDIFHEPDLQNLKDNILEIKSEVRDTIKRNPELNQQHINTKSTVSQLVRSFSIS